MITHGRAFLPLSSGMLFQMASTNTPSLYPEKEFIMFSLSPNLKPMGSLSVFVCFGGCVSEPKVCEAVWFLSLDR